MRVLITNVSLDRRRGSELYAHDVALELARRGHSPMVFSPVLGDPARELSDATIPVVDRLDQLGAPPDVIHAQHHLPAMEALTWFSDVPAVGVSHGWRPWEEAPCVHPRVRRYVAVDEAVRDRLVYRSGIDPARVGIIPNFVDTARFHPRPALPGQPQRLLLFSDHVRKHSPYLRAATAAAAELGLTLEVVGAGMGTETAAAEDVLGDHDIVLAQGRSALEALTVGTAVVICSSRAFGPMVTTDDYDRLRRLNFGIRTLTLPATAESLVGELRRYEPEDAAKVSARVRADAGIGPAVDRLVQLYEEAVTEHELGGASPEAEGRAVATYLRFLGERVGEASRLERDQNRLVRRLAGAHRRTTKLATRNTRSAAQTDRLADELHFAQRELEIERGAHDVTTRSLERLQASPAIRTQDRIGRIPILGALLRSRARG